MSAYLHRMVDLVRTDTDGRHPGPPPLLLSFLTRPPPASAQSERLLSLAQMFVAHYYTLVDQEPNQRAALGGLYHPSSAVTIYGRRFRGPEQVKAALAQMEYTTHVSWNVDCQPYMEDGCLMLVTGNVRVGGDRTPRGFTEMFVLLPSPEGNGAWFVCNQARQMVS